MNEFYWPIGIGIVILVAVPRGPKGLRQPLLRLVTALALIVLVASLALQLPDFATWVRHSAASNISTALLAISLVFIHRPRWFPLAQVAAGICFVIGFFSLNAHVYSVVIKTPLARACTMPLGEAIAQILLSIGLLTLRRKGFRSRFSGGYRGSRSVRQWLPTMLVGSVVLGGVCLTGYGLGFYDGRFGLAVLVTFVSLGACLVPLSGAKAANRIERERDELRRKLAASDERHLSVVNALPQMVWSCTPAGLCDFLSQQWLDYTGASEQSQLGYGWIRFVHPDDIAPCSELWQASIATGDPLRLEYRLKRNDGEYEWFEARAVPLRDHGGRIVKWLGSSFNIEKIRQAATEIQALTVTLEARVADRTEQLAAATNRVQSILDASSHVCIVATDMNGRIDVFNSGAEALLGYSASEVIGKITPLTWHDPGEIMVRAAELEEQYGSPVDGFDVFVHSARNNIPETRQWTFVRKDGTRRVVQLSVAACRDRDGSVVGFVGIAIDLTHRLELAASLNLQNASLADAIREAQHANRAKSEFLASMSHEIRTPMNGIIGMTGLLLETHLDDEQLQFTGTIRESSESLLALINDILDFSKIESGKLEIDAVTFDLHSTVESVVQLMFPKAAEKHLELNCLIGPDLPSRLVGDPGRIRQILLNLVSNAIKFTTSGRVLVRVEVESFEPCRIRFDVADTGIGIPPEAQQRLFKAFTQVDSSITRKFGGTGLGLAICRDLVVAMCGEIGVESSPGSGSRFWFRLPLLPEPGATFVCPLLGHEDSAPAVAPPQPCARILLAEDNRTNQLVAKAILGKLGYHVDVAANGAEAIDALREAAYDVVLMDCQMPEVDGITAARLIRSGSSLVLNPNVPIIAITAHAMKGDRERCLAAGMNDYITKPIDTRELAKVLDRWLPDELARQ